MLILAGIALNLTIGQNSIFSRAEQAANTWRNVDANEQLAMGEFANMIKEYMPPEPDSSYRWSASSSVAVRTEYGFGSGRSNTKEMLEREGSNSNTIWGVINGNIGAERDKGPEWFVPSREEFSAFGAVFGINNTNYSSVYGLSDRYWSSSQSNTRYAYLAGFESGNFFVNIVRTYFYVRLATTF